MEVKIKESANKIKRKKKNIKIVKLILLFLLLFLLILYIVIGIVYNSSSFNIRLDKDMYFDNNIIIYDDVDYKVFRTELFAESINRLDNISYKWLPEDLDENSGGSHNGDNYIVYTFFIENLGDYPSDYWSEIIIDEVVKKVDEAIRIRVYKNGEAVTYARIGMNDKPEPETIPFKKEEQVALNHVEDFNPGDIDKYTIVIWLEGTDPECTDNILDGEIKISMNFNSEFVEK